MRLRRAEGADAPACARIVHGWLAATPWIHDGPGLDGLTPAMHEGFARREVWVAEDGAVLGYLSLRPEDDHVVGLYAATPGAGVGRTLLDSVKAGRARLQLRSHAPNVAAHRFYEREGFRVIARDLPGDDEVPEIMMEWRR